MSHNVAKKRTKALEAQMHEIRLKSSLVIKLGNISVKHKPSIRQKNY